MIWCRCCTHNECLFIIDDLFTSALHVCFRYETKTERRKNHLIWLMERKHYWKTTLFHIRFGGHIAQASQYGNIHCFRGVSAILFHNHIYFLSRIFKLEEIQLRQGLM